MHLNKTKSRQSQGVIGLIAAEMEPTIVCDLITVPVAMFAPAIPRVNGFPETNYKSSSK